MLGVGDSGLEPIDQWGNAIAGKIAYNSLLQQIYNLTIACKCGN